MAIVQRISQPSAEQSGIGHNRPPLDEQVVIDLVEALSEEGITKRIDDLLAAAGRAPAITTPEIAGRYTDLIKQMVAAGRAVEAEREKLNRPLLTAQRALKGRADAIIAPLADAERGARARLKAYDDAEQEKERQRQREIAEAQRKAQQEAEAERARLQAIEDEKAAAEAREARHVEVEPAYVEPADEAAPAVIQGDMGAKAARVTTWKHRIISVRQLPDSILKNAKVIEALDKVIAAQVRAGAREIKGCEIFSETGLAIR